MMDDFNDFLFFLTLKLSTNSWDRVGNYCLQRAQWRGPFCVWYLPATVEKSLISLQEESSDRQKKHTFCALIQRCLFVGCVFPEKNPNHHGKKVMAGTRDDAVIRNSIQKPSTIFKAIILLRCAAKKFDPTCHNRQQHCHLTITGSQEKQINA